MAPVTFRTAIASCLLLFALASQTRSAPQNHRYAIRAGKTNSEALEIVVKAFSDAKTSLASINWYRNKLRGEGEKVPTARELKKKDAKKDTKKGGKKGGDPLE